MDCEYRKKDGVMNYCTLAFECRKQDYTMIKQEMRKVPEGTSRFVEYSRCLLPESASKISEEQIANIGIDDLCLPKGGFEARRDIVRIIRE